MTHSEGMRDGGYRTREEVEAMHRATRLPLLLGGGTPALSDRTFLAANGVRIALQGHHPFYASIKAVYDTLNGFLAIGKMMSGEQPEVIERRNGARDRDLPHRPHASLPGHE